MLSVSVVVLIQQAYAGRQRPVLTAVCVPKVEQEDVRSVQQEHLYTAVLLPTAIVLVGHTMTTAG